MTRDFAAELETAAANYRNARTNTELDRAAEQLGDLAYDMQRAGYDPEGDQG